MYYLSCNYLLLPTVNSDTWNYRYISFSYAMTMRTVRLKSRCVNCTTHLQCIYRLVKTILLQASRHSDLDSLNGCMLRQYTRVVIPSDTASDTAYAWLHPTIPALLCYLISLLNYSFIFWLSFLMSVYLPPSVQCLDAHKSSKMVEKTLYCARLVSYSIASMVVLYLFLYIEHSYLFRCQVFS